MGICLKGQQFVLFTMFVVLIFALLFLPLRAQNVCEFECLCFGNILECSNLQFKKLPQFSQVLRLATEELMLRNMPDLDLGLFKSEEWINLQEIHLEGYNIYPIHKENYRFYSIWLYKIWYNFPKNTWNAKQIFMHIF